MTNITSIIKFHDYKLAFELDDSSVYSHGLSSFVDKKGNIQNKCEAIWTPSAFALSDGDNYGIYRVELFGGELEQVINTVAYIGVSTIDTGICQGDEICLAGYNYLSELKALFEGNTVSLDSDGQLVLSYKGCEAFLTEIA